MGLTAEAAERQVLDDAALVELAKSGDEAAVRTLVQRHNQRLFRTARAVIRDDAEAEDIVQETYVRAFINLDGFRGSSSLATWLTRIALNEAFGRLRRRRPSIDLADVETGRSDATGELIMFPNIHGRDGDPESEAGRAQLRRLLEQAVDDLPDAFRLVLILRDIEGCSTAETAEQLSLGIVTVKTRLHRARRLLRQKLERKISPAFVNLYPFGGIRCAGMADRVMESLRRAAS